MSTLAASQTAGRVSARQIAAIGVILLTILAVFGVIGPVLPAEATHPMVEAHVVCLEDGSLVIQWTAFSWEQNPEPGNEAASANPDIHIRFDGVKVASGAFTAENGYQFSGSNPWPVPDILEPFDAVHVLAYAAAPFENGQGEDTSRRRTVFLPEDCPTTTTTTAPPVTTTAPPVTTTAPPVTTTAPPVTTTAPPVTTTQPPTPTTEPETEVLGIQVTAPETPQVNQVTQVTLPFTGISTGSMALLAAAFAGVGLLLLLAARQNDEKSPVRSWK